MKITLEDNINCLILGQDGEPVPHVLEIDLQTLRYIQKDPKQDDQHETLDIKEGKAAAIVICKNPGWVADALDRLRKIK